jgi:hypothetical protein
VGVQLPYALQKAEGETENVLVLKNDSGTSVLKLSFALE